MYVSVTTCAYLFTEANRVIISRDRDTKQDLVSMSIPTTVIDSTEVVTVPQSTVINLSIESSSTTTRHPTTTKMSAWQLFHKLSKSRRKHYWINAAD